MRILLAFLLFLFAAPAFAQQETPEEERSLFLSFVEDKLSGPNRQIRISDPMLQHAIPVMQQMVTKYEGVALLCTYYRDRVMSIHHEASDASFQFIMQRGRPFPLFRGSPSKAILAHLPPHQLKSLLLHEGRKIREAGLGETWPEFRDALRAIRNEGVYFGYGELDRELIGISSPIFRADGDVAGSITTVQTKRKFQRDTLEDLGEGRGVTDPVSGPVVLELR